MHRAVLKAFRQGTPHGTLYSQVNQFRNNSLPVPLILKLRLLSRFFLREGDVCTQAINHLAEKKSPVVRAIQTKCDRVKKSKLIFLLKPSNSESISFVLTWEQKESIPVLQLKIWNIFFTVPIDKYFQTIPMRYFLKSLSSTPRTL